MLANSEKNAKAKAGADFRFLRRFVYAAAVMFAASGLVMLFGAFADVPPLWQPDAVFGVSTQTVLVVAGLLHLVVSGCLFVTSDPIIQGVTAFWMALNYIVYLAGMAWLKTTGSIPALVVVAWKLGGSERIVFIVWRLFIAYLVVVGLLLVVLEWRRLKRLEDAAFMRHWHDARERGDTAPAASGKNKRVHVADTRTDTK